MHEVKVVAVVGDCIRLDNAAIKRLIREAVVDTLVEQLPYIVVVEKLEVQLFLEEEF